MDEGSSQQGVPRTSSSKPLSSVILGNSASIFVLQMLGQLVAFALTLVLARFLGVEQYGTYVFVFAFIALFEVPAGFGSNIPIVRKMTLASGAEAAHYWKNAIGLRMILTAGSMAGAVIVAQCFVAPGRRELTMLASLGLLSTLQVAYLLILQARWKPALGTAVALGRTILYALLVLFALSRGGGLYGIVTASVVATLAATLAARAVSRSHVIPSGKREYKTMRAILASSWPLMLAGALAVIQSRLDILMLQVLQGPEQVGLYGLSGRIAEAPRILLSAIGIAAFPALVTAHAHDRKQLGELTHWLLIGCILPGALFAVLIFAYAAPVASFFGHTFTPAGRVLALGCWLVPAWLGFSVLANVLLAAGRQREATAISVAVTLTNIVANCLLIPRFGALGAAGATVIAYMLGFALIATSVTRHVKIRLPLPLLTRVAAVCAAATTLAYTARLHGLTSSTGTTRTIAAAVIYLGGCWLVLSRSDKQQLRRFATQTAKRWHPDTPRRADGDPKACHRKKDKRT